MKILDIKLLLIMFFSLLGTTVYAYDIKVLSVYTASAKALYPGTKIITRINHHFAVANASFSDSGVNVNLVSSGIEFVNFPQQDQVVNDLTLRYGVRGGMSYDWHNALDRTAPNYVIKKLRNQYQADIVTIFTLAKATPIGYTVGYANLPRRANWAQDEYGIIGGDNQQYPFESYNVVAIDFDSFVLEHEIGHNMGLLHTRRDTTQYRQGPLFQYGYGYGVDNVFRTIMSHPENFKSSVLLGLFSNPNSLSCSNLPCGVANLSNSVLALNQVAKEISQLSNCIYALGPDGGVGCMGTYGYQYPFR